MKYFVFLIALAGVPPLIFLLHINQRWLKYLFWMMILAMCLYISTSINFFSNEAYRGSARGMEVSLIHLLSFAVLGVLLWRRQVRGILPDAGSFFIGLFFILVVDFRQKAIALLPGGF